MPFLSPRIGSKEDWILEHAEQIKTPSEYVAPSDEIMLCAARSKTYYIVSVVTSPAQFDRLIEQGETEEGVTHTWYTAPMSAIKTEDLSSGLFA